jgi:hypothetical protein
MTRSRLLTILVALALFLGSASLVQGQSTNCAELYATANALLTQAKSALDKGDLATAAALINSARALLTPSRCAIQRLGSRHPSWIAAWSFWAVQLAAGSRQAWACRRAKQTISA